MDTELLFKFACPTCQGLLTVDSSTQMHCPVDRAVFCQVNGIWRFLPPEKEARFTPFIREYETVRKGEGRGSTDPLFYRSLPFQDLTGRFTADWKIRSVSYQSLLARVILPAEAAKGKALKIMDLGAGNGWLSYQLARRGHQVAAIDLLINDEDGLGCFAFYDAAFLPIQGDFDALPMAVKQFDLVIFNASFHYATNYERLLMESLRVLTQGGQVVILDSPIYHQFRSGEQMVHERQASFMKTYGFASDSLASENYLTFNRLKELGTSLGIQWELIHPGYGLGWENTFLESPPPEET